MRQLTENLAGVDSDAPSLQVPSSVAISKSRQLLGEEPLEVLFAKAYVPIATASTRGAYYRGRGLMSMDGAILDEAATQSDFSAFGRHHSGRGNAAFPQIRIVSLAECGTHAVFAARIGARARRRTPSPSHLPAPAAPASAAPTSCSATSQSVAVTSPGGRRRTPHSLSWSGSRTARSTPNCPGAPISPLAACASSSTRSTIRGRAEHMTYRLVTTTLDPEAAPAAELAALYAERWETALDELKTHQRGARIVLGSKTSDGVLQEAWGHALRPQRDSRAHMRSGRGGRCRPGPTQLHPLDV